MDFINIAKSAKEAALEIADISTEIKNKALLKIAQAIEENAVLIFDANKKDLEDAQSLVESGELSKSTFNRLKLDENKMRDMIKGIRDIASLEDPVNKKLFVRELDEGLTLYKVSCPIGVLGIIFEARPDCFIQIASLIIKSGNCGILKGGAEAKNTNTLFAKILNNALDEINYPKN